jgi:hypothetical protein
MQTIFQLSKVFQLESLEDVIKAGEKVNWVAYFDQTYLYKVRFYQFSITNTFYKWSLINNSAI